MTELKFEDARLNFDGGYWLSIKLDKDSVGAARRFLHGKKDRPYTAGLKEYRERRSLDANAYCWALIGKLSAALGLSPEEVYCEAIQDVGGNYEIVPIKEEAVETWKRIWGGSGTGWICQDMGESKLKGYRNLMCFYGSHVYDTKQMSRLIDVIVEECKLQGIETKTPDELARMVQEWEQ